MGDEIELISDGEGVVIAGEAAAVERFLGEQPWMRYAIYVVILGGVLGGGYWMKTRKR